jgi:hypothetical protein
MPTTMLLFVSLVEPVVELYSGCTRVHRLQMNRPLGAPGDTVSAFGGCVAVSQGTCVVGLDEIVLAIVPVP